MAPLLIPLKIWLPHNIITEAQKGDEGMASTYFETGIRRK
jgi:hypothetical protein